MGNDRLTLQAANFSQIQSMVMKLAAEIQKRDGMTRSRSLNKAADQVAALHIDPPTSGVHLDKWLGTMKNAGRWGQIHGVEIEKPEEKPGRLAAPVPDVDDFGRGEGYENVVMNDLIAGLKTVSVGQVVSFKVKTKAEAEYLRKLMPAAVKRVGWRGYKNQAVYRAQVLDDRLKIKRLV